VVGAALLLVSLGTAGVGWGLSARYESKLKRIEILGGVPSTRKDGSSVKGPLNFLLLGSDSRLADPSVRSDVGGQRSDTIILIHVSSDLRTAYFVSIPRDSYVDIPPSGDAWRGGKNKINAAFAFGGPKLTAETVYALTRVPLDGATVVDFDSVRTMVNVVGGVTVCVPYNVSSLHTKRVWKKGCHHMSGDAAQDFMRQRKSVPGSDFGRIHNQQLVLRALATKATSAGMLTDPVKFDRLITTATKAITVDEEMDVRELAFALKNLRPDDLQFITLPFRSDNISTPAGSAVALDEVKCEALFDAIRNDTVDTWLAANPQRVPTG
jgi:LCP family protein required for cell wall assembly